MALRRALLLCGISAVAIGVALAGGASAGAATGTVGTTPASYTPRLLATTPNQYVHRLVPCGGLMYAVGTISAIGQGWNTYTRGNAFSFSQTTGAVTAWDPQANGKINDITFSPDCSVAYLGGTFTTIRGVTANRIAAVDTTTGNVITSFKHNASSGVYTTDYVNGQVLVGGTFGRINGVARTHFASLNPTTGSVTSYANLSITGNYPKTPTKIDNTQVSHGGGKLLVEGVFTSIDGQARQQVAVFDLGSSSVSLDGWNSPDFANACVPSESYYVRAAAWSPDDATIYTASTGYHPASGPGSSTSQPRAGLCDSVAAFSAASSTQHPEWINYTGCDSYYGVAADDNNVYVTGHERWANNPLGCDFAGPGAVSRPGLASIDPVTGQATSWNPTRSLGHGGDDMVITSAGLWVASDNWTNGQAQKCGGVGKHGGICFLPY